MISQEVKNDGLLELKKHYLSIAGYPENIANLAEISLKQLKLAITQKLDLSSPTVQNLLLSGLIDVYANEGGEW